MFWCQPEYREQFAVMIDVADGNYKKRRDGDLAVDDDEGVAVASAVESN
jgi:hypothetical protein